MPAPPDKWPTVARRTDDDDLPRYQGHSHHGPPTGPTPPAPHTGTSRNRVGCRTFNSRRASGGGDNIGNATMQLIRCVLASLLTSLPLTLTAVSSALAAEP